MMVTVTKDLTPQTSRLVKADAAKSSWPTVPGSVREASYLGGNQSQVSGYYDPIPTPDSPRGWVYIVANNFDRSGPVFLYRVPPQDFTDRAAWQGWSSVSGRWGDPATALWPDRVGEMSIRLIDGKAVLSYFNATTGDVEMRVADDPTQLGTAPVTTVVYASDWPDPADPAAAGGEPARPAIWRLHLTGLDARRGPRLHQPVEHPATRRHALPRDPVRGEPPQAVGVARRL